MVVGAQLYTLREYTQNEKDLAFCLKRVAEMGYTCVQISKIGPIVPKRVRALCDEYGLGIVLTHTDPDRILNDTDRVIQEHDVMGCHYIGLGAMPERYRSPVWFARFADDYLPAARRIAESGKLLMYHNHNFEFEKYGEELLFDHLLEAFAPEEMGVTLDTYWVQMGGADTVEWIEKLKYRIPCVHLKDMAAVGFEPVMAPVGEGNMNFHGILRALEKAGATKYLLVEQDYCRESPFDCLKKSYNNLKAMGYR